MTLVCDTRAWIVSRTNFFQASTAARASIITDPKGLVPKLFRTETRRGEYTLSGDVPGTGQPQGKGRTEALVGSSRVGSSSQNFNYDPGEGDDYWHWWQFEFPNSTDEPTADPVIAGRSTGDNMICTQVNSIDSSKHGPGLVADWQAQSPNQALLFGAGAMSIPKASFQIGKRYEILVHIHWSTNGSVGFEEVWLLNDARNAWVFQGKKFEDTLQISGNGAVGNYWKFGQYHHFSTTGGPWVKYESGVRVGTARVDVDPLTPVTTVPGIPVLDGVAGDTLASLTWTATSGAESYKLFHGTTQIGGTLTGTSYVETGLTNGVPVNYTVKAHNSIGDSAASNTKTLTPTGGSIKPPVASGLQNLVDPFDGTTADGTIWTSLTGTQSQANGKLSLQATSASIASRKTDAKWSAEGVSWPFRLSQAAAYASGPATTVETRVMLTARDAGPALGDFVVAKVVKTNTDTVGQMSVIFVHNDVQDNPQTSTAVPFTYDPVAMLYGRFVVNDAGTTVAFQTSPDGTTWTTRRAATTPSWTLASTPAKVELTSRITSGTGAVTPAIFDEVGTQGTVTPPTTSATVPVPGGLQANDLIVMTAGIGNQAANLQNFATLPFRWFGTLEGGSYGDGIANVTARAWAGVKVYNPLTDTASWPLQFDASTEYAIEALVIRGAQAQAADQGISGVLTSSPAAGTSFTVDCGSSPVAGARVYILAVADTDATAGDWAAGAGGLTRVAVGKRSPEGASIAIYAQTISAAGTAVSRTVSHAASVAPVFISWFVRPGQSG